MSWTRKAKADAEKCRHDRPPCILMTYLDFGGAANLPDTFMMYVAAEAITIPQGSQGDLTAAAAINNRCHFDFNAVPRALIFKHFSYLRILILIFDLLAKIVLPLSPVGGDANVPTRVGPS